MSNDSAGQTEQLEATAPDGGDQPVKRDRQALSWSKYLSVVDWHRASMWASFLVPLTLSIGANIAYALSIESVVWFIAGIAIPLLLVFAAERWRALPSDVKGWQRAVRVLAVAAVAAVAAGITWRHTAVLLLDQYPVTFDRAGLRTRLIDDIDWWLCTLAPVASDGLAVVSLMALRSGDAGSTDGIGESSKGDQQDGDQQDGDQQDGDEKEPVTPSPFRDRTALRAAARELNAVHGYKIVQDQPVAKLRKAVADAERDVRARQADGQTGTDGGQAP